MDELVVVVDCQLRSSLNYLRVQATFDFDNHSTLESLRVTYPRRFKSTVVPVKQHTYACNFVTSLGLFSTICSLIHDVILTLQLTLCLSPLNSSRTFIAHTKSTHTSSSRSWMYKLDYLRSSVQRSPLVGQRAIISKGNIIVKLIVLPKHTAY